MADAPAGFADDTDADDPDGRVAAAPGRPDGEPDGPASDAAAETTAQVVEFAVRTAPGPANLDGLDHLDGLDDPAGLVELPSDEEEPGDRPAAGSPSGEAAVEDVPLVGSADPAADVPPRRLGRRRGRSGPNKRQVRHQQTREAIVDAAAALFSERGFDAVSVQQIAQRAGVVEKTVFNHFPVKEGLVFESDPPMRAALVETVRRRPAGESAAAAAGSFVVAAVSQLGSEAAAEGVAEMARVIRGSRTLQTREREILGTLTDALAEQIAMETRAPAGTLEPWLAAHAVLGLYAALMERARDRVLAGASGPELVTELRTQGRHGLALLQFGLAGYAKRR